MSDFEKFFCGILKQQGQHCLQQIAHTANMPFKVLSLLVYNTGYIAYYLCQGFMQQYLLVFIQVFAVSWLEIQIFTPEKHYQFL